MEVMILHLQTFYKYSKIMCYQQIAGHVMQNPTTDPNGCDITYHNYKLHHLLPQFHNRQLFEVQYLEPIQ